MKDDIREIALNTRAIRDMFRELLDAAKEEDTLEPLIPADLEEQIEACQATFPAFQTLPFDEVVRQLIVLGIASLSHTHPQ